MLEWLIIGGGIHGTHISALLTQTKKVPNDRIRVLDPYPEPLSRWNECTENCGMSFLRSPDVHHIDLHPFALHYFSKSPVGKPFANFTWPYDRPSLELFQIHCKETIKKYRL
ncbi:MAG: hypothetical protein JNN15_15330, partial [Blastocatellia bacterium]|nr:hypothetical protein [Blastocatellia bacterium]